MAPDEMKNCKRCRGLKPLEAFHLVIVQGRIYRQTYCKLCQRVMARDRARMKAKARAREIRR